MKGDKIVKMEKITLVAVTYEDVSVNIDNPPGRSNERSHVLFKHVEELTDWTEVQHAVGQVARMDGRSG